MNQDHEIPKWLINPQLDMDMVLRQCQIRTFVELSRTVTRIGNKELIPLSEESYNACKNDMVIPFDEYVFWFENTGNIFGNPQETGFGSEIDYFWNTLPEIRLIRLKKLFENSDTPLLSKIFWLMPEKKCREILTNYPLSDYQSDYDQHPLTETLWNTLDIILQSYKKMSKMERRILLHLYYSSAKGILWTRWHPTEIFETDQRNDSTSRSLARLEDRQLIRRIGKNNKKKWGRTTHVSLTHLGMIIGSFERSFDPNSFNEEKILKLITSFGSQVK